jgi:hypothetical protein
MARTRSNTYEPVMRLGLATLDEKKATQGYTDSGFGVTEVERPGCESSSMSRTRESCSGTTPCCHPSGEHAEQSL